MYFFRRCDGQVAEPFEVAFLDEGEGEEASIWDIIGIVIEVGECDLGPTGEKIWIVLLSDFSNSLIGIGGFEGAELHLLPD